MTSVMYHIDDKANIDEMVETYTSLYGHIGIELKNGFDSITIFLTKEQAIEMAAKILREAPELKDSQPEEVKYPF